MNTPSERAQRVAQLLERPAAAHAVADPLRPLLASMLAGRTLGEGVLPGTLGLLPAEFRRLVDDYFPGMDVEHVSAGAHAIEELGDLFDLLVAHRAKRQESEVWLARSVAWGCGGCDHLWQDLGLAHRGELSFLMQTAFTSLAALNVNDMKWKKFIYRQYCSKEGIYVCPTPSCAECADFNTCYAPEG
ncbi:MAG: nitrogen fixation protein NifQ [Rhodoferax sp.]|nr:nitrogen fixation protein NifQ [Rhodoferax sp.]